MKIASRWLRIPLILLLLLTALPPYLADVARAAPGGCGVSGEAYGAQGTLVLPVLGNTTVAKTGVATLPPGEVVTGASLNVLGLLATAVPTNAAQDTSHAALARAQSTSTLASVNILGLVQADTVEVFATSRSDGATAGSTGGTTIANLRVNGTAVTAFTPGTQINLLGGLLGNTVIGTVTIDERLPSGNGTTTAGLTVNALHVRLTAGLTVLGIAVGADTEIIVGSATSGATCSSPLVPSITSLSPSSLPAGSASTAITVNGANFAPDAQVWVDGALVGTTFVSGTQLTAMLPAAALAAPGTLSLTVQNPGGGTSAPAAFIVTAVASPSPSASLSASPSASPSPPAGFVTLTLQINGSGTVTRTPGGEQSGPLTYRYPVGTVVQLVVVADTGWTFTRWDYDGGYAGWPNPVDLTMDADHTMAVTLVPTPAFGDVPPAKTGHGPIIELTARQIIRGYGNGNYGPDDLVQRAQMAALIVRSFGWNTASCPAMAFTDRQGIVQELWDNVCVLADYGVALGYRPASCAERNLAYPCFGPLDRVTHVQTIAFITRAMVRMGYWQNQPPRPGLYGGVLDGTGHEVDVATYLYYTQGFGGVPDYPATGGFPAVHDPASRAWFARALWTALDSHFSIDRVP